MTLADDVTLDELIMAKDDLSGADIKVSAHHHCLYFKAKIKSHFCCIQNYCHLNCSLIFCVYITERQWDGLKCLI